VFYQLSKRFTIESGVLYASKGFKMDNAWWVTDDGGFALDTGKIYHNYRYLDVPLKVNFNLTTKKIKIFISAGVVFNIFINRQFKFKGKKDFEDTSRDLLSPFNFSAVGGLGMDYAINQRWGLRIQSEYQQMIDSTSDESEFSSPFNERLYSYGLNLGMSYRF
jgi:lipopolysaccharide assembly outer membrane protein LptD (OstA)